MKFYDRTRVSSRTITKEGFLKATARVGRPGVQQYIKDIDFTGDDLPENLRIKPSGTVINIFRPPGEVFNADSMASFEGKPITNNHPIGAYVDSTNVKRLQVGFSQTVVKAKDGEAIEATLIVQDKLAIKDVQDGKDQISLGYEAMIEWTPGVDETYGTFDGVQRNIHGNHIAIVDRARAGTDFRLNDKQPTKGQIEMKTRIVDGKSIELSDDAADIFDAMKVDKNTMSKTIVDAETKIKGLVAELETVKGERDAAKAKSITDADIDAKVAERVTARTKLIDTATKVVGEIGVDKTDAEIRLEVIKKLGDGKVEVDGKSDEYILAVFDALITTAKPKAKLIGDGLGSDDVRVEDADKSREGMVASRGAK